MKIGVESYGSFGDCCILTPLFRDLSAKYSTTIDVAVHKPFADAFQNLPFIKNIHHIDRVSDGTKIFKELKYDLYFNASQGLYYKSNNGLASLIDVPVKLAKILKVDLKDRRPIFYPTKTELEVVNNEVFDIAIESQYNSNQSWSLSLDIMMIIKTFKDKKILWCSKGKPPVEGLRSFNTRRETITALKNVKHFFCVGSGIFCASLSEYRPENTYVLWTDDYFKYKKCFSDLKWDTTVTWLETRDALYSCLNNFRVQGFLN
jgi:hypothetical protein